MKRIATATLVSVALFIGTKADAQELPGCFMVSSSGQVVSLNNLCQSSSNSQTTRTSSGRLPLDTVIENAISNNVTTYCEERSRGLNQDEAYSAGRSEFADYVIGQGYTAQDVPVSPGLILIINNRIEEACPNYAIDYSI